MVIPEFQEAAPEGSSWGSDPGTAVPRALAGFRSWEERHLFLSWSLNSAFSSWSPSLITGSQCSFFLYPSPTLTLLDPDGMQCLTFHGSQSYKLCSRLSLGILQSCLLDCKCQNTRLTLLRHLHDTVTPQFWPMKSFTFGFWEPGSESRIPLCCQGHRLRVFRQVLPLQNTP